jgi:type IX secretion system PorP/SprF family membrane protein
MKLIQYTSILLLSLLLSITVWGQQESMFTQYVYNTQLINPGYVGYKEALSITAHHRSQWVGFEGAPHTSTVSIYSPLKKKAIAVGATISHDIIGPSSESSVQGDIAYRMRLSNRATLSFGAKVSVGLYQVRLTEVDLTSNYYNLLGQNVPFDEAFAYNTSGVVLPNIGFGAYYYKKNYFLGVSSPRMIQNKLEKRTSELYDLLEGTTRPTLYVQGGYLFDIDKDFKLQPTGIIRVTQNAPMSIGAFVNAIFIDKIRVGLFYHYLEAGGAIVQYQINDQMRVGYALDVPTNRLITTSFGSHEIMFNYQFNYRRRRVVYPRYF